MIAQRDAHCTASLDLYGKSPVGSIEIEFFIKDLLIITIAAAHVAIQMPAFTRLC